MDVSVILPTYNEAGNIEALVRDLATALGPRLCEVLVVDDDSPDGTWQLAQGLLPELGSRLRVIRRTRDRGLRASLAEGISEARGEVIAWMDADFSMPPALLPEMLDALDSGADVVVASRYVDGGSDGREDVPLHRLLSRIITSAASLVLVPSFRDYTSGYIAIRAASLRQVLPLEGDYGEYFIALIYRAFRRGQRIVELPYRCAPRRTGESKTATNLLGFARRGWGYARLIARLRLGV